MHNQKHLFQLPEGLHYLNGAYMSPLLTSSEEAAIIDLQRKRNPASILPIDFFTEAATLRSNFGKLINSDAAQIAIIPSVSYGIMNAVQNIPLDNGQSVIMVTEEFPSGFYAVNAWCNRHSKTVQMIHPPETQHQRGALWSQEILNSITEDTCAVVMSSIHWTDGTLYDLASIGKKCQELNVVFIVDGSQSVGALPIDVQECNIDALICTGYKWLLGPYSLGMAYYGPRFDQGSPIEESWMTRSNAEDFTSLTSYTDDYKPGAMRYNVGEASNFGLLPILNTSILQILEWGVENIQNYSNSLITPLTVFLTENNFQIEEESWRSKHLFGFKLPPTIDRDTLVNHLKSKNIIVSARGNSIRVSTHVYNGEEDVKALMEAMSDR